MATTWINRGHFYAPHVRPVLVDCNFVVDSTNGNGAGTRNLKGQGVQSVFMNTSAAFTGTSHTSTLIDGIASGTGSLLVGMPVQGSGIPAGTTIQGIVSSGSITLSQATTSSTTGSITYQAPGNPNPPAGYMIVKLADNFNRYYGGFSGYVAPVSGTPILVASAGVTLGDTYVITLVGTTTYAGWVSLGMPPGITPAVGVSFTATATATATGSGVVETIAPTGSGVNHIEVVGDPNTTLWPIPVGGSPNVGGILTLVNFASTGSAGVNAIAAPANGTPVGLAFYLGQSNTPVLGE
jgi:hypothetical protein